MTVQAQLHDRKCNCGKPESQHTGKRKMCPNHGYTFSAAASSGDVALGATCPDCHAPVGVQCVTIVWRLNDGQLAPTCEPREPHTRRRKRINRFGPEASKRP